MPQYNWARSISDASSINFIDHKSFRFPNHNGLFLYTPITGNLQGNLSKFYMQNLHPHADLLG